MNKDQANELKVGVMVLVCLGLGLGVALKLSNWEQWMEPKNTLTFKVPYQAGIGGIKAGWPVTIGGVAVGSVQEITSRRVPTDKRDKAPEPILETEGTQEALEQAEPELTTPRVEDVATITAYSYFTFTVPSKYKLYEDCELKPAGQLIGGAGELVIANFGGEGRLLQDGDEVFRQDLGKGRMDAMMDKAQQMMATVQGVIAKAQEAMDRIGKITEDIKGASADVKETVSTITPKLESAMERFDKITEDIKSASADVKETVSTITPKVEKAMERVDKVTEDLKDFSGNLRETIGVIRPQLEKTMANLRETSAEVKMAMREIRWNPWRLMHNPSDRELRTQNLLTAARSFSSGASDLDAATDKLEGLLAARKGKIADDDPELIKLLEELKATVAKFNEAEETFFKRLGKGK